MRYDGYIFKGPNHKCKGCEKRYLGCHDHCEDYIKARDEFIKERKDGYAKMRAVFEFDRWQADQYTRQVRRKR